MLKIVWILLWSVSTYANMNCSIEKFMIYKTDEVNLSIETIKNKKMLFEPLIHKQQFNDTRTNYWLQIKLDDTLTEGKYLVSYVGFDFYKSSFSKHQNIVKYISNQKAVFRFDYNPKIDEKYYYFKLINLKKYVEPSLKIENFDVYYQNAFLKPDSPHFFLFFGLIVGLIFMVSIYNIAIYYYSKEVSFLYYSLMEFFMIVMMVYQMGIVSLNILGFNLSSLLSGFFATLFMRSFLQTKKYLPKLDKALQLYLLIILVDIYLLLTYDYSLVMNFALYSIFGIIYFIVGFLRLKQGFTPAKFFLLGWSMLVISIFYTEHIGDIYGMNPLIFGPPLEAIFLAIGLAYKLKLELDEKKEQQNLLVHQSKLASMGEMIGNISHQWKQPLSYLSYNFMNLREAQKRKILDDDYLNKKLDKAEAQLEFMSQTIDNFRDFYLPNKEKKHFSLEEATMETIEILSHQFKQKNIELQVKVKEDSQIFSYKSEYKQVLLNLLTNAKDALLQRNVVSANVKITLEKNVVLVEDNAGGIPLELMSKIYEPYFTTKEGNSGIGLYMSKLIMERDIQGRLEVKNTLDGALFTIYF